MSFDPGTFRAQLSGSGARPTLFDLTFVFPAIVANAGSAGQLVTYMCSSATKPAGTLGLITIPYFGRDLKYPGDRTFATWSITIINDENFSVHDAFLNWSNIINSFAGNIRSSAAATPTTYMADVLVNQYSKIGGSPIKQWKLVGMWPKNVGEIQLSWGPKDTVEEFNVDLEYQWFEDDSGVTDSSSF